MDSSAFWDAIEADDVAAVERLISLGGDVDGRSRANADGLTPVHYAAQRGAINSLETLLRHSRAVDAPDRWGSSPLQAAVANAVRGGIEPVEVLLTAGADPRRVNALGITPLSQAQNLAGAPTTLTETLLAYGRTKEQNNPVTPLLTAARTMAPAVVLDMIENTDAVDVEHENETPLRAIVWRSLPPRPGRPNPHPLDVSEAIAVIRALLRSGAEVQHVHDDGFTPQGVARSFLAPREITKLLDGAAKKERS